MIDRYVCLYIYVYIYIYMVQRWTNGMGARKEVGAVALDINKAFDQVWHERLLLKLSRIGIHGTLLN